MIDCHVHIGKSEKSERWFSFETFSELMERFKIDSAVVMPNISSVTSIFDTNNIFLEEFNTVKERDTFYPFLLIDPFDKRVLNQVGNFISGLKLHPSISRVRAMDRSLWCYYELASERNLPILVHCGRDRISNISFVIEAAKNFPNLSFIAAHLGGNASDIIEEAFGQLQKRSQENVYLDTSNGKSPWLVEEAVKIVGSERVLFGSDEPFADFRICKMCIEFADLSEEVKESIFNRNIIKLLKKGAAYSECEKIGKHKGVFQTCLDGELTIKCKICGKVWNVKCTQFEKERKEKAIRELGLE